MEGMGKTNKNIQDVDSGKNSCWSTLIRRYDGLRTDDIAEINLAKGNILFFTVSIIRKLHLYNFLLPAIEPVLCTATLTIVKFWVVPMAEGDITRSVLTAIVSSVWYNGSPFKKTH